jgi:hypothetical protein
MIERAKSKNPLFAKDRFRGKQRSMAIQTIQVMVKSRINFPAGRENDITKGNENEILRGYSPIVPKKPPFKHKAAITIAVMQNSIHD